MTPSWDWRGELVRLASKAQIESVHVHGRRRLWRGWPVDWDAGSLLTEVREMARQRVARAPSTRWSAWMNDGDGHALDVTLA
jgi:5-methylthioadenosine/S-adenosylhomocysteine deaminase